MSSPWIREPETGRYYMYGTDRFGNPVRRYSEELHPAESYQSQQPTAQYTQWTPRSELGQNSYLPTSSGPSNAGDQRYESGSSWARPSGNVGSFQSPGTYQPSQVYSPTAPNLFGSGNVTSMTNQMNDLTIRDQDKDPQYTSTAPSGPSWTSRQPSSYNVMGTQGQGTEANRLGSTQQDQPSSQNRSRRHITRTDGDTERLDPRYRIRNNDYQKFFREGRVFSTLWTDPASKQTNRNQTFISTVTYGEEVHTKIRRFVVVRQNNQNCICLPVTSYEGRGYKKGGIELDKHGQIYSSKRPKDIPSMPKKPLKIELARDAGSLTDQSLINYGTPYTVECNVKVMNIGELDSDSRKLLLHYYSKVNFRPDDYYGGDTALTMDTKPQRKEEDLAGVGTGFTSNPSGDSGSSTYGMSPGYDLAQGQTGNEGQPSYTNSYSTTPGYSSSISPSSPTQSQSFRREVDYRIEEEDEDIKLPTREDAQSSRSSRSHRDRDNKSSRSGGKERERDHQHRDRDRDRHRHRDRDRDRDRDRRK